MSLAAFLLAVAGFAALALSMSRHFQALTRRAPSRAQVLVLRAGGAALLAGSLWFSLAWLGSPVGIVAWFGLLNAGALVAALGLTLARRQIGK
jgi:hypothetical protein